MEFHRGTSITYDLATLPADWKHTDGLNYPLKLRKIDGTILTFYSYQEHNEYIKQLFRN